SINSEGIAAQFTSIKGRDERFDFSCNHRATNSFPEPFSPVINTRASVGATFSILSLIMAIPSESPNISFVLETLRFSTLVSFTKDSRSNPFRTVINKRFRSRGFSKKRSEEHTSELQSRENIVCRLLLEKKKKATKHNSNNQR